MSDPSPIIDVNPVASTSDAAKSASPSGSDTFRAPSYGKDAAQAAVNATIIDEGRVSKKKPNRIGGAVQTAIGGAIMLVGVPHAHPARSRLAGHRRRRRHSGQRHQEGAGEVNRPQQKRSGPIIAMGPLLHFGTA